MRKTLLFCLVIFLSLINIKAYACSKGNDVQMRIEINIPTKSLSLYKNDQVYKTYPVAVGKSNSQTPIGEYKVLNKLVNPYYSKKNIAGGSPYNPLGSRWLGFKPHYGIHGNNDPSSIGTFASAGCVRMFDKDVKELYELVSTSTPVIVKYDLFKVDYDIDDQKPVLIVYPDYYRKESNIMDKINTKLAELELTSKISNIKLETLKSLVNKKTVVFSEKWTYFINGKYVTDDIININGSILVNAEKTCRFFNIEILEIYNKDAVKILDREIPVTKLNNNNYVLLSELEKILGGTHTIDKNMERIDYNLNYILLNNKLIIGEAIDINNDVKLPLSPLINALGLKVNIGNNATRVVFNNTEISYTIINDETYIDITELTKISDSRIDTYTIDNHVEIFSKPDIIYRGTIFKGMFILKEACVPYNMLEPTVLVSNSGEILTTLSGTLCTIETDNQKYVKISDLAKYFNIKSNTYNTKIYINID